jgi:hypothetical protein
VSSTAFGAPPPHPSYTQPHPLPAGHDPYHPPAPARSRTGWYILGGIVAAIVLFLVIDPLYLFNSDPAELARLEAQEEEGRAAQARRAAQGSTAPQGTAASIVGRWCVRTGYSQFNANGTFFDSAAGSGTWQDMSGGRINMTVGGQTIAATYSISGNVMNMTTLNGAQVEYTRC